LLFRSYVDDIQAVPIAAQLRLDKAKGNRRRAGVLEHLEIVLIPKEVHGQYTIYPGLFLFSTPARMIRPVMNLITKTTEYVGTLEQVYLGICITHDEFVSGVRVAFARLYHRSLRRLVSL
jgi:DNA-directed RNA polymerase I subunit RPA2